MFIDLALALLNVGQILDELKYRCKLPWKKDFSATQHIKG